LAFTTDDPEKPITAGVFTVTKADTPLLYKYGYHETKIILEGELWLEILDEEESKGKIIKPVPGDIIRIAKGTHVSFSSPTHGKGSSLRRQAYCSSSHTTLVWLSTSVNEATDSGSHLTLFLGSLGLCGLFTTTNS
jgi:Ethanolamine utilisation protein EutQ